MGCTHRRLDERRTQIRVEGLAAPLRLYQFSDTHLQAAADHDPDLPQQWRENPLPKLPCSSRDLLCQHLERAIALDADLILMVGDLFHFPSPENHQLAETLFDDCPLPVWLVPGNHDWFYPGMDGWEPLRSRMLPRLKSLFPGEQYHFWSRCLGGVRFVALDNSAYFLDAEQSAFLEQELRQGQPTVVLLHIPLSLPEIRPPVLEKFGMPLLMADPEIDYALHKRPDVDVEATFAAAEMLRNAENLIAILSGHVHLSLTGRVSPTAVQYISGAGYRADYRLLELV